MKDGMVHNVLYVPKLSTNLLSIYQITNSGAGKTVLFNLDSVIIREIKDPSQIVATGKVDHHARLYSFSHFELTPPTNVLLAHSNELSRLWHERVGHLNYRYLQQLSKQNMVIDLLPISFYEGVCTGCILGKNPQHNFDKGKSHRASEILQLVHSHILGPFPILSFQRAHYLLTFIDDYSRHTWVYFLKNKSETFDTFLVF